MFRQRVMIVMELYNRIKIRREELGMSQEELAHKLGYKSRSTINKIEMGKNDITQSKIKAFAEALNCSPAYLMGWEDSAKTSSYSLPEIKPPSEVDPDMFVLDMYKQLDIEDKAEVRGTMKQMLKADKYNIGTSKIVDVGRVAAYGGKSTQIVITEERQKAISNIKRKMQNKQEIE